MNPFQVLGYIGEEYFCGREKESEILVSSLKNGRNSVVYGWRRLGKSALLHHVLALLSQEKYIGIYVDLYGTANMKQATECIADSVLQATSGKRGIGQKLTQLIGRLGATLSFDPYTALPSLSFNVSNNEARTGEKNLLLLYEYLNENHENVVVVLDEFQQITSYKGGQNAEAVFRSLMQRFPKIRFVFSGSHRGLMLSMFGDSNRPFYKSCDLLLIEAIPFETYQAFIVKWMSHKGPGIDVDLVKTIYTWANGQTLYVQMVCNRLYEIGKKIRPELLSRVFSDLIIQESHYFQHINDLLTDKQTQLMRAIAKEQVVSAPTAHAFLSRYNLGTSGTIIRTLNSLENKTLIIKTNEGYRIHDTLLSRWYEQL